ncbi:MULTISPECIES: helix-turn-helix domain-containing protein [unclassified Streptomyces]|uniref:helix-turn-helix domain-containing protein n=1 Tax=unclassified Streptomyces TaxID=2593676 RepID=UPI002E7A5966|nr:MULTISPECIES: helix-turn-helix transcriptional regulator [unclassified Streptomyces]MEE1759368.1 helix-turn-helix transcriptional regulator [Streptomyces sp. SP18BB07]MEE1833795.1 helix-turn-helix transcriptional regulator [Streptomyces sp. SP17KL33]
MVHGVEWAAQGPGGEPESSDSMRAFGAVVQALREHAGLSREEFGARVHLSKHSVASIELGRRLADQRFVELAEGATGNTGAVRGAFRHMARQPGLAAWFRTWARLEREAVSLDTYECRILPGLLQSEGYVRAAFANNIPLVGEDVMETQVQARLERQQLLRERPNVSFNFIIDEAVLRSRLGGPEVMKGALDHVLTWAGARNVHVQIMPMAFEAHACLAGPLRLLETGDGRRYAYTEGQQHSQLIVDVKEVVTLGQRYATLRSQALPPGDSMDLLRSIRGAL